MQSRLAYWAVQYRAVNEMPSHERPEKEIIEDDERFDTWCETWVRDKEQELARLRAARR